MTHATRQCSFLGETDFFYNLYTNILKAAYGHACGKKKVFLVNTHAFSMAVLLLKQCALTPAICQYYFSQCLPAGLHYVLA
jgi:hypothetical protein